MERKDFYTAKLIPIFLILSIGKFADAQNLVPNPSFEEYTECPDGVFQIDRVVEWESLIGPVDYYHECGTNGLGIPINRAGGGFARTGQAYTLVAVWGKIISNGRKYISVELESALAANVSYYAEFYVSMTDSLWYATRNLGIHFSASQYGQDVNDLLALEPQVKYESTEFLDDKIGWTRISGHFTAQGGERYLAIGSFDNDLDTDTLFVSGGGVYDGPSTGPWQEAAYFVDDVLLVPDSIYLSNEELEIKNDEFLLYPNPASDQLTVDFSLRQAQGRQIQPPVGRSLEVTVVDVSGRMVLQHQLQATKEIIDVGRLPRGVYVVVMKDEGVLVERKRLVLQ